MKAIRVAIADDNLAVRRSLTLLLASDPGIKLVGQAIHCQQALDLCAATLPDVLVLDLNMPGIGGIETTRLIRQTLPQVSVLILTSSTDRDLLNEALEAGARGCFTKDISGERLLAAIHMAAGVSADHEPIITA